jgi:GxxExxY protein
MAIKLIHEKLTREILGAFYTEYNECGCGFLENVYKNALCIELQVRQLSFRREVPTEILYLRKCVGTYKMDLLVEDRVLVEVKASSAIGEADNRQLFNYLRASRLQVGLLLHFGPKPTAKRFVWTGKQFQSD